MSRGSTGDGAAGIHRELATPAREEKRAEQHHEGLTDVLLYDEPLLFCTLFHDLTEIRITKDDGPLSWNQGSLPVPVEAERPKAQKYCPRNRRVRYLGYIQLTGPREFNLLREASRPPLQKSSGTVSKSMISVPSALRFCPTKGS